MTAATIETGQTAPRSDRRPVGQRGSGPREAVAVPGRRSVPARRRRSSRGSGRRAHPAVRPVTAAPPPVLGARPIDRSRACRVAAEQRRVTPAAPTAGTIRLTERGISVVLIAGAMVLVAAVTVIAATALTVTSESFSDSGVISAIR